MSAPDLHDAKLRRLIEVMPDVISDLDLETLLQRVLAIACELTDAQYAAVGVLDEDRRELERFLTRGVDDETREAIGDLPRGRGVLGVLIDQPAPLRLADVGSHPSSYGFPPGHPPMSSFLGVPILIRGEAWGNLYLAEKHDGEFTQEDENTAIVLAAWVGIAVHNARLYESERRRAAEMEQAVRGMRATTDIAKAIGGETELGRVLELIVKRGRALVHAGALVIALRDGDELAVRAAAGTFQPALLGASVPLEGSIGGAVLERKRPQRLSDVHAQLRFMLSEYVDAESGLIVPLLYRGRGVGVLYAFDRQVDGPEFTRDDEILLEAFAASAATAVATAQEFAEHGLQRSIEASERERRRWARELHDQTLQDLGALKVLLSSARRTGNDERLRAAVGEAVEQLARGIDELRAIITDLRPAALDEVGTQAALEALADRVRAAPGTPEIDLDVDLAYEQGRAATRHTEAIEDALYRVVQEAITNATKHAGARRISVSIEERDGHVHVWVRDDGAGFEPEATSDGFGLIGMRERLALVHGELEVFSRPGAGTEIHATVPAEHRPPDEHRLAETA
jgi:signal transduction histidine kinase